MHGFRRYGFLIETSIANYVHDLKVTVTERSVCVGGGGGGGEGVLCKVGINVKLQSRYQENPTMGYRDMSLSRNFNQNFQSKKKSKAMT